MKSIRRNETNISELLKDVHLTEVEYWVARGHAARAEYLASLIVAAGRGLRSLAQAIERASRLPARTAQQ